ncbi:Crp/Fnr family transcriptional regulator [Bacillus sp. SCS-151]|uniref:Crp/Fnr family transcriptional regulator n=1 Tax=Nanhaiella sioensis TaxID=3115293 RepID=UPI00397E4C87
MDKVNNPSLLIQYLNYHQLDSVFSQETQKKMTLHRIVKGETLCTRGDTLNHMYFLVKGKIKIYTISPEGKTRIVRFKKPIAIIGDIEFIKKNKVIYTVEAASDGYLIGVSYEQIRNKEENRVTFVKFLLEIMTHKFFTESQTSSLNILYSVEVRLASYLLSISSDEEGSLFHQEMRTSNLTELADLIGTSYRHLNRVIQKLDEEGVIERRKGAIYVKNLNLLRERAEGNIYE